MRLVCGLWPALPVGDEAYESALYLLTARPLLLQLGCPCTSQARALFCFPTVVGPLAALQSPFMNLPAGDAPCTKPSLTPGPHPSGTS